MSSSSYPPQGKQEQIQGKDKSSMNKRTGAEKYNDDVLKACIASWVADGTSYINIVSPEVAAMNAKIERAIYGKRKGKKRFPVFEAICPSED